MDKFECPECGKTSDTPTPRMNAALARIAMLRKSYCEEDFYYRGIPFKHLLPHLEKEDLVALLADAVDARSSLL